MISLSRLVVIIAIFRAPTEEILSQAGETEWALLRVIFTEAPQTSFLHYRYWLFLLNLLIFVFADCCTLIAVATFQGLGTSLLTVPENLLQPYGYGLVLAWCCWVLHLPAVPLVVFEAWYRNREPDNDEPSHSSSSRPSSHSRVRPTAGM